MAGLKNFYVTLALVLGLGFATDVVDLGWAADNYLPLMTCGVLFSVSLSVVLFAASHAPWRRGVLMARGADTGYTAYDWYMGRELNPRIGGFDVKQFVELIPGALTAAAAAAAVVRGFGCGRDVQSCFRLSCRQAVPFPPFPLPPPQPPPHTPVRMRRCAGLLGWMVLDLAMARKQLAEQGRVSGAMALVCAFQGLYVWDALQHESAILTTMDITTDGLGYMLAFGNLAWVPFTYSLQARVLLRRSPRLSTTAAAALVLLKGLGYAMFRGSNNQKDQFRRDPTDPRVAKLQSMPTQRGTRLLTSGWWGMSRHPNYLGDWIMAWAWCLPCGLGSGLVPYFYVIYFAVLLGERGQGSGSLGGSALCLDRGGWGLGRGGVG